MAWFGMAAKGTGYAGRGMSVIRKLWILFVVIMMLSVLLNAIVLSMEAKDASVGIEYLGSKFLHPIVQLNDISLSIIENQGISALVDSKGPKGWFDKFLVYLDLLSSIFIIYFWLFLLSRLWAFSPFSNISQTFINWGVAIIIFIVIQMLLLSMKDGNIMLPIDAFINLFKAIPYIIKPITAVSDKYLKNVSVDNINNTLSNINLSNMSV